MAGDDPYISTMRKLRGNEFWHGALALTVQAFEKKVHKHSSPKEFLKLAEVCLLAAERTLDREVADMLLLKAGRYLDEWRTTPRPASTIRQALMEHGTIGPISLFCFAEG